MEGSWKDGLNTSKEVIAEEPKNFIHKAESRDGECMYTRPSADGQMYKSSCTLRYWSARWESIMFGVHSEYFTSHVVPSDDAMVKWYTAN